MLALVLFLAGLPVPVKPIEPLPAKAPADRPDGPPVVSAKAWVVADGKSGKVLWGSSASEPLVIASTTKIMTARLVFKLAAEDPRVLDETVTFSEKAAQVPGSSAKLKAGEKLPVRELFYGMLLPSGNDAAHAFAEHFGPRFGKGDAVAAFVARMNREAASLKMGETKYLDPHGLAKNVASARDLATLAARTLPDERFRGYVSTRRYEYDVVGTDGKKRRLVWENTNRLLGIEGYDGVKTGTTTAAGSCLVASGRRDGNHVIVVVLGSTSNDSRYVDARNLFRWAWGQR
jgi:serine-type D-Ala-D-Ala carboxypeptidase (penicillin-binding protein 5/6)